MITLRLEKISSGRMMPPTVMGYYLIEFLSYINLFP